MPVTETVPPIRQALRSDPPGAVAQARCVCGRHGPFMPVRIERRALRPDDVLIEIAYAGICHSDVEHARSLRGGSSHYPLVPGHEIAGTVAQVGAAVTRLAPGDRVGVGNMVSTCRTCSNCRAGLEQYCTGRRVLTYNAIDVDGTVTQGGYSDRIVVNEHFVLRIPDSLPLQRAAPLFCAGITLYSPLRHWKAGPGTRVGIIGFGGLGHLGVQIARAMGAEVAVFDLSDAKRADAMRLGAHAFHLATDPGVFTVLANRFDLVISTVPANVDLDSYLGLLALNGVLVTLSIPSRPLSLTAARLLGNRRSLAGTLSGGIPETQEMIDFCARHGIGAEVEVIHADGIDAAYERLLAGDVRYRFVIDIATMAPA